MPKRTNQPSKRKKSKRHGFRVRSRNAKGKAMIKRKRAKGRKKISS